MHLAELQLQCSKLCIKEGQQGKGGKIQGNINTNAVISKDSSDFVKKEAITAYLATQCVILTHP